MPRIPAIQRSRKEPASPAERKFHWDDNVQGLVFINISLASSVKRHKLFKAMLGKGGKVGGCISLGGLTIFSTGLPHGASSGLL